MRERERGMKVRYMKEKRGVKKEEEEEERGEKGQKKRVC